MDHYAELKREMGDDSSPEVQMTASASAFPVPASLILIAIKYALKKAWSPEDREKIKAAVLKIYDDFDFDIPIIDGLVESAVERVIRSIIVSLLDAVLG